MNYVRIDFEHCGLDYDYTICNWKDMADYIESVESDIIDSNPDEWEEFGQPKITITPVSMTHEEYAKWFSEHVESEA